MTKIGFVGLGTMGAPMARNLLSAGHELFFFARRPPIVEEFRQAGAKPCINCAEVAATADLVITIVTADREVEEVLTADDGVVAGGAPGKLVIDMSTISPVTVRRLSHELEAVGMSMLDAPVSGGPSGAQKGTLSIMVGGSEDDFRRAQPVLKVLGEKIFHLGPNGAGQTVKLVNQMIAGGTMALVAEAISVGKAAGLDLHQMIEAVSTSSGNSTIFASRARFVADGFYEPGFKAELMRKDIALALDLASEFKTPTPVTAAALQQYTTAVQQGLGQLDFAAVAKLLQEDA